GGRAPGLDGRRPPLLGQPRRRGAPAGRRAGRPGPPGGGSARPGAGRILGRPGGRLSQAAARRGVTLRRPLYAPPPRTRARGAGGGGGGGGGWGGRFFLPSPLYSGGEGSGVRG